MVGLKSMLKCLISFYNTMLNKMLTYVGTLGLMFIFAVGLNGVKTTAATSEETPCSPPVEMADNPRYLVERCNDGAYVIDTEDGSRAWISSGDVNKVCEEDGICIQLSS